MKVKFSEFTRGETPQKLENLPRTETELTKISMRSGRSGKSSDKSTPRPADLETVAKGTAVILANSTISPSPSVSSISVILTDTWVDQPDPNVANEPPLVEVKVVVPKSLSTEFLEKVKAHKWFSVYFLPRAKKSLSRTARVLIILCLLLTHMGISSVFYNTSNHDTLGQQIVTGAICSAISFVVSQIMTLLFKIKSKRVKPLIYVFCVTWCLGAAFITFWYNISFDEDKAKKWCVSLGEGMIQDILVHEPIKIIIKLIFSCLQISVRITIIQWLIDRIAK